jgi:hypothetical protein
MLDWSMLNARKEEFRKAWATSGPTTRFLVFDNLLDEGWCEKLRQGFHILAGKREGTARREHKHVRGKAGTPNWERMTDDHRAYFLEVNSPEFCRYMEEVTGIAPITADPTLAGGGLHEIRRGGYLRVHTDFNFHPATQLNRRLNLLLYLNPEWKDEWNGHIELWNEEISRPYLRLAPLSNRALLFETTETSYHGHPAPLATPPDVYRRSMATYYYAEWPDGLEKRGKTGYQLTKQEWGGLITRVADLMYEGIDGDEAIVERLFTDYQTGDIKRAIKVLRNLRSADLTRENYLENPDGTVAPAPPKQPSA